MVFAKLKIEEIFEVFDRLVGKGIKNSNRDLYMYVVDNIEKEYSWFYSNRRKLLSNQKIQKKSQNSKIEIVLQVSTYLAIHDMKETMYLTKQHHTLLRKTFISRILIEKDLDPEERKFVWYNFMDKVPILTPFNNLEIQRIRIKASPWY